MNNRAPPIRALELTKARLALPLNLFRRAGTRRPSLGSFGAAPARRSAWHHAEALTLALAAVLQQLLSEYTLQVFPNVSCDFNLQSTLLTYAGPRPGASPYPS